MQISVFSNRLKASKIHALKLIYAFIILTWLFVVFVRKFDFSNISINSIAALFTPVFELGLFFTLCVILSRFGRAAKLGVIAFSFVFFLVYAVQFYFYFVAGEFVAPIALENAEQIYLLINFKLCVSIILLFCLVFALTFFFNKALNSTLIGGGGGRFIALMLLAALCVFQYNGLKISGTKYLQNTPPFISLIKNFYKEFQNERRLAKMGLNDYIFMKDEVFSTPPPFKSSLKSPNIIVLFMEGVSARTLEIYGGKFKDLTPNFSKFAQNPHSMLVQNYFNHTAATFRGTHGQLASCYPEIGGYGQGMWADKDNKNKLDKRIYQTLPRILNKLGFKSIFVSPIWRSDAYTNLLQMLGFEVKSFEDYIAAHPNAKPHHNALTDADTYAFIKETMQNLDDSKPFFISSYIFQTHTGIDLADISQGYGDKKSPALNTLHEQDRAFGEFWRWFEHSKFAQNTIVVLTADHAHYHDNDFVSLMRDEKDYKEVFVDKIPLIIYAPTHELPCSFDAQNRTSLDLTPTLLHLLDIKSVKHSFLGHSLFEKGDDISVAALGQGFYLIFNGRIYDGDELNTLSEEVREKFKAKRAQIELFYVAERRNKVFKDER